MPVPSRHAQDLFRGVVAADLPARGGAAGGAGLGRRGRHRPLAGREPELTAECQAFRGTLGTRVAVCRPADPEAKGPVERATFYLSGAGEFITQTAARLAELGVPRKHIKKDRFLGY